MSGNGGSFYFFYLFLFVGGSCYVSINQRIFRDHGHMILLYLAIVLYSICRYILWYLPSYFTVFVVVYTVFVTALRHLPLYFTVFGHYILCVFALYFALLVVEPNLDFSDPILRDRRS